MRNRILIGLTGGIGSGKSRVCQFWKTYFSLPSIDVDLLCRDLLEKEEPGWLALKAHFKSRFFLDNGNLDRPLLREALFTDHGLRRQVDTLLHPLARTAMERQILLLEKSSPVLLEVPLLYEAGWQDDVDQTVVVYAANDVRCRRIIARDGVGSEQALSAINAQEPLFEKALKADHVIENSGSWLLTCLQVLHLGRLLLQD